MQTIINKVNIILGVFVTFLSYIFGDFWYLFAVFLSLNIIDYITGTAKARILKKENSQKGFQGIFKKVAYWLIILLSFQITFTFAEIGKIFGIDLAFVQLFGWLTLATFIINEFRSIFENLIECGIDVPIFLIRGLDIADALLKREEKEEKEKEEQENE